MTTARRARLALVTLVAAAAVLAVAPRASADPEPTLDGWPTEAAPGQAIDINGTGWPARELVTVEVCGNAGRGGSADCDQQSVKSLATSREGELYGKFTVGTPPSPCPCVIAAWVPGSTVRVTSFFHVTGHEVVHLEDEPEVEDPGPRVDVRAELGGSDSFGAWFGGVPKRTLHLEIENLTRTRLDGLRLRVSWGRDEAADGMVDVPDLDPIRPRETVRLDVPVELAPLSAGKYVITGEIRGEEGSAFTVRTSSYPWGLVAVPLLILLQWLLLELRNRLRRRVHRDEAGGEGTDDPAREVVAVAAAPAVLVDGQRSLPLQAGDTPDSYVARLADAGLLEHPSADTAVPPETGDAADEDDEDEYVGGGRGRTLSGIGLAVVAGLSLWIVRGIPEQVDHEPLEQAEFCEELEDLDVVSALAGTEPRSKAVAIARLSQLADRAPDEVRISLAILQTKAAERPGLDEIANAAPDDADAWTTAYRAVYALDFDNEFIAAATRVEKYAVEFCGMAPSGVFDLDVPYAIDASALGLDFSQLVVPHASLELADPETERQRLVEAEAPTAPLAQLQTQLRDELVLVEAPEFQFDNSDWEARYGPG